MSWTTGEKIIDDIPLETIKVRGQELIARRTGRHRGYDLYLLEDGSTQALKDGHTATWHGFNNG